MRTKLFLMTIFFIGLFTYFSYTVAKERWQKIDFDTTVKLQNHIPRKFDYYFSYFSLLGSIEMIGGFCLLLSILSFLRKKWLAIIGWLLVIPASFGEIFGKLVLFHPGTPVFLHRSILPTTLPSFYISTDFSYPSGHMTRIIFVITILLLMTFFSSKDFFFKLTLSTIFLAMVFMMGLTRVYLGEHWLSDVIGGMLLGAGAGFFSSMLILQPKKV